MIPISRTFLPKHIKKITKNILGHIPLTYRKPKYYNKLSKFLDSSHFWDIESIEKWQLKYLQKTVNEAYNQTDGYKQLYSESGIHPKELHKLSDLQYFPTVNKELISNNLKAFSSKKYSQHEIYLIHTSGSSGKPFHFYNAYKKPFENSFMHNLWKMFGIHPNELQAVLKGGFGDNPNELFELDRYNNNLQLSVSQLSEKHIEIYLELIKKYKIRILRALPSSLYLLCKLLENIDSSKWPNFEVISISSENNYYWQNEIFKKIFPKAKIFSWYGHAEKSILAPYCEKTDKYHLWPFYGVSEILDINGKEVSELETGKLFGTSLFSDATFFIRYDTNDIVEKGAKSCQKCGRNFQILNKIHGRSQEFILTKTGRKVTVTVLNILDNTYQLFDRFQFYQDKKGELVFKYQTNINISSIEKENLIIRLKGRIGPDIDIILKNVLEIERSKSGKYKFMDQKLII